VVVTWRLDRHCDVAVLGGDVVPGGVKDELDASGSSTVEG
jgi:hypothetical protein